jgi:hypothetical protein
MLRRIPISALRSPGRRSLVSLTSSARPTLNPNSQHAPITSSSSPAKMFEFDVKSVAGEMRKRGLTSAATRDAGMDRVSVEGYFFSSRGSPFHPNEFIDMALSLPFFSLFFSVNLSLSPSPHFLPPLRLVLFLYSPLSPPRPFLFSQQQPQPLTHNHRTPSSASSTPSDLVTKSKDTSGSSARLLHLPRPLRLRVGNRTGSCPRPSLPS